MTAGAGRGAAGRVDGSAEKPNFNLASVGKGRAVRERRQVAGEDLALIRGRHTDREGRRRTSGPDSHRARGRGDGAKHQELGAGQQSKWALCPCPDLVLHLLLPIPTPSSPQAHAVGEKERRHRP